MVFKLKWLLLLVFSLSLMAIIEIKNDNTSSLRKYLSDILPPFCRFYGKIYRAINKNDIVKFKWMICESRFTSEMLSQFQAFLNKYFEGTIQSDGLVALTFLYITFRARAHSRILDDSFHEFKINKSLLTNNIKYSISLEITHLKGFNVDSSVTNSFSFETLSLYTDFNLDKTYPNFSSSRQFFSKGLLNRFHIHRLRPLYPICSLFFRNASIKAFTIQGILNFIDPDVFSTFENIRNLIFDSNIGIKIIRRQGIQWMKSINARVRVNVSDRAEFKLNKKYLTRISMIPSRFEKIDLSDAKHDDADFCLFVDFPFGQMVFIEHAIFT